MVAAAAFQGDEGMFSPLKRFGRAFHRSDASPVQDIDRRAARILGEVAHEMSQPLSAARAAFQLIRTPADDTSRERATLVLDRQFAYLAYLLEDLTEIARLRTNLKHLRLERVELRRLVSQVIEDLDPQVAAKQQRLDLDLPDHELWIEGDAARLHQVSSNLLLNAIRYTDAGGLLQVVLTQTPHRIVLKISDTGRGMKREELSMVFHPFTSGSGHGLGLGLAVARELVELHGGTIHAESLGPGRGSSFFVVLPAEPRKRRTRLPRARTASPASAT
jgi:signal transduction histidine kinase